MDKGQTRRKRGGDIRDTEMNDRNLGISLAVAAAMLPASAALADVKTGVDAWSRGDYPAAVREWQPSADKGDPDAQYNLAQAYKLGRGVKPDLRKAEDLFGKAAQQGHLQASDMYGLLLFQRGERAKAMPYVRAAAERGEAPAQYLLGVAHFNGENVPKDWVRAYALTSLALQAGLAQARQANGRRREAELVCALDCFDDTKISNRENVRPVQPEHQKHLSRPAADALHAGERGNHFLIGE